MNDSTRQPRTRTTADAAATETQADASTVGAAATTLVQLPLDKKVEVLQNALTALLERHKAMQSDYAFVDAQRALNVVIYGVKPE